MTNADEEIIGHLLYIRSTIGAIREDVREMLRPVVALEDRHMSIASQLDRIDSRLARIERYLDLTDA
jgi:hypothetical protein